MQLQRLPRRASLPAGDMLSIDKDLLISIAIAISVNRIAMTLAVVTFYFLGNNQEQPEGLVGIE